MITTYTFSEKNNSNNNGIFSFLKGSNKPNYSKILDDIILADVIKKNSYLFKNTKTEDDYLSDIILTANSSTSSIPSYKDAVSFLANYKSNSKKYILPYKLNKKYTLSDGTPIIFYDDEVQIGFDYFAYADLNNIAFINTLTPKTKKIIIDIYATAGANININIL